MGRREWRREVGRREVDGKVEMNKMSIRRIRSEQEANSSLPAKVHRTPGYIYTTIEESRGHYSVIVQKFLWRHIFSQHLPPKYSGAAPENKQQSGLGSSLAVLGNVAGLTTVVTGLGHLVGGRVTVLGNVAVLAAGVALDGTGLTVLGKVVGATALVAHGALGELGWELLVSWRSRSSTLVLWALSGDVAELRAVVALGALGAVWAVASDVANVSTQVALLGVRGLWLRARRRLVAGLATVVAQSFFLLTVVGNVAGLTALVTGSWEHGRRYG